MSGQYGFNLVFNNIAPPLRVVPLKTSLYPLPCIFQVNLIFTSIIPTMVDVQLRFNYKKKKLTLSLIELH